LLRATLSLDGLKEPARFLSWTFTIARRLFLNHCTREVNEEEVSLDQERRTVEALPAQDGASDEILFVRQALQALEPEDRVLLLLVDLEAYSYKEAAEIIGISEAAARSRLHRVRKKFVEKFEKD